MFVAASTDCFPHLRIPEVFDQLVDLQFTAVELALYEHGLQLKPSQVHADVDAAIDLCRSTKRMTLCALAVDMDAPEEECYEQFQSICKLAKATKVVAVTVRSSELGTPFNAEVERLRKLVSIASLEGVLVGLKTETGRMSQDPSTVTVLCENIKGLGITLDPSHFIFGPHRGNYDQILKYVIHVHLRDTTREQLQVRVGQGDVEYGRIISQLMKLNYHRALSVDMQPQEGIDHLAEMRKIRQLLESFLL